MMMRQIPARDTRVGAMKEDDMLGVHEGKAEGKVGGDSGTIGLLLILTYIH